MKKTYKTMFQTKMLIDSINNHQGIIVAHFFDHSICDEEVIFDLRLVKFKVSADGSWIKTGDIFFQKKRDVNQADRDILCDFLSNDEPIVTSNYYSIIGILYAIGMLRRDRLFDMFELATEVVNRNDKYEEQKDKLFSMVSLPTADSDMEIEKAKNNISFLTSEYIYLSSKFSRENKDCNKPKLISVKPRYNRRHNNYLLLKVDDGTTCYFRLDFGYFFCFSDTDLDYVSKQVFAVCGVHNEKELKELFDENPNRGFICEVE